MLTIETIIGTTALIVFGIMLILTVLSGIQVMRDIRKAYVEYKAAREKERFQWKRFR